MEKLYDSIKCRVKKAVDGVKDFFKPYWIVHDSQGEVLVAGHHKRDISQIAEIIDVSGDSYAGFVRVDKKQYNQVQAQIRDSGRANLATVLS